MAEADLIISEQQGVTVVDFRRVAALDALAAEAVARRLYELIDRDRRAAILLDLSAVRFMASQMVGTMATLHKKAGDIGGKVVACGLTPNLLRVFQISRLDEVLHFAADVPSGLAMLRAAEAAPEGSKAAAPAPSVRPLSAAIQRHIRIFFAGAMVLVPLAITAWIIWSVGTWLDGLGHRVLERLNVGFKLPQGVGALILLAAVYFVGLLTHLWLFRGLFGLMERLIARLPGVKTIYESVRDLMKLFGGSSQRMGRVVQYNLPGTDVALLGILTNENPLGLPQTDRGRKVAVYFPLAYMVGGPTMFVSAEQIVDVDMSVEQCMKLCATAQVGGAPIVRPPSRSVE